MTDYENLCMNCMSDMTGQSICPHCGSRKDTSQMAHALPLKTRLQKRYLVGLAQRSDGEGIVYRGYDTERNAPVEIREFFPQSLCERAQNGMDIRIMGGSEVAFDDYLRSFLNYSRGVEHLHDLPAIVPVYDIFEENHAAYAVSEWQECITLHCFVQKSGGLLGWNEAKQLFLPVLSALSVLHANSICHLGISPDTLLIYSDGRMRLGDFCIGSVRQLDTDLPPNLTEGCAAIEQYIMDYTPNEATDVYGFAASLLFSLTGSVPPDALKRRSNPRLLIPRDVLRKIPPYVVKALANALQISPDKRTPTFERLRTELSDTFAQTGSLDGGPEHLKSEAGTGKSKRQIPGFVWVAVSCAVVLILFAIAALIWKNQSQQNAQDLAAQTAVSSGSSTPSSTSSVQGELITAPNLVGQEFNALQAQESSLPSAQQNYQILQSNPQFSDTIPEGCIISQQPAAGSKMTKGTAIVVVVSKGAALSTLPTVAGKTLPQASSAVTSAGFVPSEAEEYSDTVPKDRVIEYKSADKKKPVKPGSQMAYGSKVTIVVSLDSNPQKGSSAEESSSSR